MGGYDVAQICRNGHVITSSYNRLPQFRQPFCDKCGGPTINECPACKKPIRGEYFTPDVFALGGEWPAPAFCLYCGRAFPWTQARLDAARALADETEGLNDEERALLKKSLNDLVSDTPNTPLAAQRFKRLVAKAGKGVADTFHKVLVDVLSEAAKKLIWPTQP